VRRIVTPNSLWMPVTMSHSIRRVATSRPMVGSSMKMTVGWWRRARAISSFFRIPVE